MVKRGKKEVLGEIGTILKKMIDSDTEELIFTNITSSKKFRAIFLMCNLFSQLGQQITVNKIKKETKYPQQTVYYILEKMVDLNLLRKIRGVNGRSNSYVARPNLFKDKYLNLITKIEKD